MARSTILALVLLLACVFADSIPSRADEVYTFIVKKQEEKKSTRWNLADWLAQRDSMRLQDLWLSMHTPTPYEFYFGGDYRWLTDPKDQNDHRFAFGAFAKIFGLGIERETKPDRWNLLFLLRVFGLHNQSTNITLHGGLRSQSDPQGFRSGIFGGSFTLNLLRYVGVETTWRHYFPASSTGSMGTKQNGNQFEANGFIDFRALRIYGGYLKQAQDAGMSTGYQAGARLYF